jgi:hypothetical protein
MKPFGPGKFLVKHCFLITGDYFIAERIKVFSLI